MMNTYKQQLKRWRLILGQSVNERFEETIQRDEQTIQHDEQTVQHDEQTIQHDEQTIQHDEQKDDSSTDDSNALNPSSDASSESSVSIQSLQKSRSHLLSEDERQKDQLLQEIYHPQTFSTTQKPIPQKNSSSQSNTNTKYFSSHSNIQEQRVIHAMTQLPQQFPAPLVKVIQADALKQIDLIELLASPTLSQKIQPNLHLVSHMIRLARYLPQNTHTQAKYLIQQFVQRMLKKFKPLTIEAIRNKRYGQQRHAHPRPNEIDWHRTIHKNLKHYQAEQQTLIVDRVISKRIKQARLQELILCVDRSASMVDSMIYSSLFATIIAHIPSIKTRLITFDTEVYDLSDQLHMNQHVEMLLSLQLGGGTHIAKAMEYCQQIIESPRKSTLVLISDLYEGSNPEHVLRSVTQLKQQGVSIICLLALSDEGEPEYHVTLAQRFAQLSIPTISCTPDLFPEMIAHILSQKDLSTWKPYQSIQRMRKHMKV